MTDPGHQAIHLEGLAFIDVCGGRWHPLALIFPVLLVVYPVLTKLRALPGCPDWRAAVQILRARVIHNLDMIACFMVFLELCGQLFNKVQHVRLAKRKVV